MTRGLLHRIRTIGAILLGLLRELSDENAYHRHLTVHGLTHSGPEWRRFSETRMREKYMRAKCC